MAQLQESRKRQRVLTSQQIRDNCDIGATFEMLFVSMHACLRLSTSMVTILFLRRNHPQVYHQLPLFYLVVIRIFLMIHLNQMNMRVPLHEQGGIRFNLQHLVVSTIAIDLLHSLNSLVMKLMMILTLKVRSPLPMTIIILLIPMIYSLHGIILLTC